ncbi:MAG TPA: hypothetical protein VK696_06140 [Steroidobacteraceae bacterium]|jgi:hypothetical protein|nr:hypothetical protein [Steroidobacteraceae bacterium]
MPVKVSYLQSVAALLTWRMVLVAQALAIAQGLYSTLSIYINLVPGRNFGALIHFATVGLLINEIGINCVVFATLCAYAAVRRGANGWLVYPVALLFASGFGGFAQWPARDAFHMRVAMDDYDPEHPFRRYGHMLVVGSQFLLTGTCFLLVYTNRAREVECILLTRAAQLRRARIERELAQSELITVQTRLDPEQIHLDLQRLRDLYIHRSPQAESELDALVQSLRQRTRSAILTADAPQVST